MSATTASPRARKSWPSKRSPELKRYLDFNATCPPLPEVIEAVSRASASAIGNPSSLHWAGRAARRIVDDARDRLAAHLHCESGSVVFTSGGTESDNIAIHATTAAHPGGGTIITTAIEHPAVLRPLEQLQSPQWQLQQIKPNASGVIDTQAMIEAIDAADDLRLVCIMLVNNESGAIQPAAEIARHCRTRHIPILIDAVQALGKIAIDATQLDADFIALSAHKIGGPKGVGALIVRRGVKIAQLAPGGGQERGRRSGTENVPGIAGFAAALGIIDFNDYRPIRDHFESRLCASIPESSIIAADAPRSANTSLFTLPGVDGETILMQLDLAGFAVASGSACSSGKREPSHVLRAMGVNDTLARSAIRVSFGPGNSTADADALIEALLQSRNRLKQMAGF